MFFESVESFVAFHCTEKKSNKLWGYFTTKDDKVWVSWWCVYGGSPNFKVFGKDSSYDVKVKASEKQRKGYDSISLEKLKNDIPDIDFKFLERFTLFKMLQWGKEGLTK